MLSEKPWKAEAVLMLGTAILFCLAAGMLLASGLSQWIPGLDKSGKSFVTFVAGAVLFQGASLVWVHIFLRHHGTGWREGFGLALGSRSRALGWGCLGLAAVLPGTFLLGRAAEWLLTLAGMKPELQMTVRMLQMHPPAAQLLTYALGAVLLAPVAEEVLFRGILYPTLKKSGYPQIALWTTALLFGSTHGNWLALIPLTFLAAVLTWLYERTGNLLTPILTHILFNAVNFTLLVVAPSWVKAG
jgi:membrane protease YdiL (CAAX protease family)